MDYEIKFEFKGGTNKVLIQDNQNILGAIGQFYEDHVKECRIIKIKEV